MAFNTIYNLWVSCSKELSVCPTPWIVLHKDSVNVLILVIDVSWQSKVQDETTPDRSKQPKHWFSTETRVVQQTNICRGADTYDDQSFCTGRLYLSEVLWWEPTIEHIMTSQLFSAHTYKVITKRVMYINHLTLIFFLIGQPIENIFTTAGKNSGPQTC